MDDHTHPTRETITLFTPQASADPTATAQQHIDQLAARLGLDGAQLSALHAVMTWAAFLRPSTDPGDRVALRTYLPDGEQIRRRQQPRQVKLVGDRLRRRIVLVDVQQTNGHVGNGRLEVVV